MTDKLLTFPTRDGESQGDATERVMLSAVGGPDTIRTRLQENPDGSTTMLRTRGGSPEFTTQKSGAKQTGIIHVFYGIPVSEAHRWGFRGASDVPMVATDEEYPGSAVIRPTGLTTCSVTKNQAWVTKDADETYPAHPGNATWVDDRKELAQQQILSWWVPIFSNRDFFVEGVYDYDATKLMLGSSMEYFDHDTAQRHLSYDADRANLGNIYIDGDLLYSAGKIVLAAALHYTSNGAKKLRYLSPATDYLAAYRDLMCIDVDIKSGVESLLFTIPYADFLLIPQDSVVHSTFNASGTKFIVPGNRLSPLANDTYEYVVETGGGTNLSALYSSSSTVSGTTSETADGMAELESLVDDPNTIISSRTSLSVMTFLFAWYEGDTRRWGGEYSAGAGLVGRADYTVPFAGYSTFEGRTNTRWVVVDGEKFLQTPQETYTRNKYFMGDGAGLNGTDTIYEITIGYIYLIYARGGILITSDKRAIGTHELNSVETFFHGASTGITVSGDVADQANYSGIGTIFNHYRKTPNVGFSAPVTFGGMMKIYTPYKFYLAHSLDRRVILLSFENHEDGTAKLYYLNGANSTDITALFPDAPNALLTGIVYTRRTYEY
jgi:hypothetical protein